MTQEKTVLHMRMPIDLKNLAQKKADEQGESLSVIVRQLLREWVQDDKK